MCPPLYAGLAVPRPGGPVHLAPPHRVRRRFRVGLHASSAALVVDRDDGQREVYTIYLKFAREVLNLPVAEQDELKEILRDNPDIDFL